MFFNGKGFFMAGGRKANEGLSGSCCVCGRATGLRCPETGKSCCSLHLQHSIAETQRDKVKPAA